MGWPLPALAVPVLESSVPPAPRWPAPCAPLAGVRPTSAPPPVSSRPRVRTPAGSARIVPLWLSCSPKPDLLRARTPKTRYMVSDFTGGAKSKYQKGPIQSSELNVHVYEGGQAIVGAVSTPKGTEGGGGSSDAEGNTP